MFEFRVNRSKTRSLKSRYLLNLPSMLVQVDGRGCMRRQDVVVPQEMTFEYASAMRKIVAKDCSFDQGEAKSLSTMEALKLQQALQNLPRIFSEDSRGEKYACLKSGPFQLVRGSKVVHSYFFEQGLRLAGDYVPCEPTQACCFHLGRLVRKKEGVEIADPVVPQEHPALVQEAFHLFESLVGKKVLTFLIGSHDQIRPLFKDQQRPVQEWNIWEEVPQAGCALSFLSLHYMGVSALELLDRHGPPLLLIQLYEGTEADFFYKQRNLGNNSLSVSYISEARAIVLLSRYSLVHVVQKEKKYLLFARLGIKYFFPNCAIHLPRKPVLEYSFKDKGQVIGFSD